MYENFKCWKYNSESGWVELQNMLLPTITWYMNWWGYLDPYHYHVPWGTTTFQIHAVFEQLKALILIGEAYGISGNETIAGPSLEGLCYLVDSINALESEPEESATTDIEILTCICDYNIFVFQGEAYCVEELEGEEEQVVGIEVDHIWNPDTGMYTYTIVPEEIAQYNIGHEYLFVYLLSCYQGRILDDWHNAFNSSCSLGFWDRVFATPAKEFDAKIWEFVSMGLDIYNSAIISANIINEEAEFQEEPYILYPLIPIVNGNAHLK